jgi:hypothetical protein
VRDISSPDQGENSHEDIFVDKRVPPTPPPEGGTPADTSFALRVYGWWGGVSGVSETPVFIGFRETVHPFCIHFWGNFEISRNLRDK